MISIMLARPIIPGTIGSTEMIYNSRAFDSSFHGIYEHAREVRVPCSRLPKSGKLADCYLPSAKSICRRHTDLHLPAKLRSKFEVCSLNTEQITSHDFVDVTEIRHARYFRYSSIQSTNL